MAVSASGPSASDGDGPSELPADEEEEEEEEARTALRTHTLPGSDPVRLQEPQLVYTRVAGEAPQLLAADVATAVGLCGRLVAVGTRRGAVVLYDTQGKMLCRLPSHRGAVNDVSFDATGAYVATSSEDGTVAVASTSGEEHSVYEYHKAVKSVALDPGFAGKKSRQFACGGAAAQLVLNSKGWMGSRDHVLHAGEGTVRCVRWCGALIAWANDLGVKLYDSGAHARIAFIDRPQGSPRPEAFPPHLAWETDKTLIIGWADCIKVARISVRGIRPEEAVDALEHGMESGIGPVCVHVVDVVACFQTEYFVSGVAPFGPGRLVVLAYTPPRGDAAAAGPPRPEVRCVSWANEELTADALALRGHERASAGDLMLAWNAPAGGGAPAPLGGAATGPLFWAPGEAPSYLLAAPRDVVLAAPRDVSAHVAWLATQGRYGEALDACDAAEASAVPGAAGCARSAGDAWLESLLAERQFSRAAALCPRLLRGDVDAWEATAFRFAAAGGLPALARHVPTGTPSLSQSIYEMILAACVGSTAPADHAALVAAVRSWPPKLYAPAALAAALRGRVAATAADAAAAADDAAVAGSAPTLPHDAAAQLKEALAEVLLADGQVTAAAVLLLELGSPSALALIAHHRLLGAVADRVVQLAALDHEAVVALLVEERTVVPPGAVAVQLRAARSEPPARLLQRYLAELHEADAAAATPWAGLQVELTARFAPTTLMSFLASSTAYPLEAALATAAAAGLVREQVFVLGRMGDARRALGLILDVMGDVDQALEFVQGQADARLWDELIARAGASPVLAGALLERIGGAADARPLLLALPSGARIENLRDRLRKLLADVRAQAALWHGCNACLRADVVSGGRLLYAGATRALRPTQVRWV